jgi:hypothetical protein
MGGVWLGFSAGLQRKVEKMGKVTKKKVVKIFRTVISGGWSASQKRSSNIFGRPPPFPNF